MNKRQKKIFLGVLAVLILGAAYFLLIKITGFYIPCIFKTVTGLSCPGCGISHMCRGVIESVFSQERTFASRIMGAASHNYFVFFTSPFIIFEIIYSLRCAWKQKRMSRANEIILYVYIGLLIAWAVTRNVVGL